jgi:NAD(P)-dependent dehydrogenase (short-subunit alcohol dehydrogenase family)
MSRAASSAPKAALDELGKNSGCMIFTASGAGFTSAGGGVIYTASKHAVVGIIRQLAVELGPKIRVNGVAPGGTMTDLRSVAALSLEDRSQFAIPGARERIAAGNPLQLALEPADLAGAYVFLASRANARGITGSVVSVDAGSTLRPMRRV